MGHFFLLASRRGWNHTGCRSVSKAALLAAGQSVAAMQGEGLVL